jgi:hypothetical protein
MLDRIVANTFPNSSFNTSYVNVLRRSREIPKMSPLARAAAAVPTHKCGRKTAVSLHAKT